MRDTINNKTKMINTEMLKQNMPCSSLHLNHKGTKYYYKIQHHNEFLKDSTLTKGQANLLFWLCSLKDASSCKKKILLELTNMSFAELDESCEVLIEKEYLKKACSSEPEQAFQYTSEGNQPSKDEPKLEQR